MSLLWWVDLQDLEFLLWLSPGGVTTGLGLLSWIHVTKYIFSWDMVVVPGQWWGVWNRTEERGMLFLVYHLNWNVNSLGFITNCTKKKKKKRVFTDYKGLNCNSWRISKTLHLSQELYLMKMNLFWLDSVVVLEGPRLRSPDLIIFTQNRSKCHIVK